MLQKPANLFSYIRPLLAGLIVAGIFSSVIYVLAAPPDSRYDFAETLTPACVAGSTNCTVVSPARSGANSDITGLTGLNTQAAIKISPFSTSSGNTGEIRLLELAANGENYTGFKAANSIAANVIWTLPSADGTSNQVLTTNGSGVLSWATVSLSGYVPYTGASSAVDLGAQTLTTTGTGTFGSTYQAILGNYYDSGYSANIAGRFHSNSYFDVLIATDNASLGGVWAQDITGGVTNGTYGSLANYGQGVYAYGTDYGVYGYTNGGTAAIYGYDSSNGVHEGFIGTSSYAGYFYDGSNSVTIADGTNALNIVGNVYIQSGYYITDGSNTSIDPYNRQLYANDGSTVLIDYASKDAFQVGSYSPNILFNQVGDVATFQIAGASYGKWGNLGSAYGFELGSGYNDVYIKTGSNLVIPYGSVISDGSYTSIDPYNRQLKPVGSSFVMNPRLDWSGIINVSAGISFDDGGKVQIGDGYNLAMPSSTAISDGTYTSIDPYNRKLHDISGNEVVTWDNSLGGLFSFKRGLYINPSVSENAISIVSGGIGFYSGTVINDNSVTSIDPYNRQLLSSDGSTVMLDYSGGGANYGITTPMIMDTLNAYASINPNDRLLYGYYGSSDYSIDYANRYLYANDGLTIMLDWSTDGTADFGDNDIKTTGTGTFGEVQVGDILTEDYAQIFTGEFESGIAIRSSLQAVLGMQAGGVNANFCAYDDGIDAFGSFEVSGGELILSADGFVNLWGTVGTKVANNLIVNSDGISEKYLDIYGRKGTTLNRRGGHIGWYHGTTTTPELKGYTYVNTNGRLVFETTAQASTTDTGNAWISLIDGSASFAGHTLTIGSTGNLATTGTGTFTGGITTEYATEDPMLTINGQIAVSYEGTAPRIRFVANGTEYYIDKTGGFGIPGPETSDPISGDKMGIGDIVLGMINQNLGDADNPEDSSLHGIWVKWDSVKAQLLAEARGELASSGSWGLGEISGVSSESMIEKVKNVMVSFGMSVEGTLLRIKDLVVEKFSAKTARIEKLEMVDSATGQIYCTWIQNGEWEKTQGECASAFVANTVPEEVVSTNEAIVLLQKDVSSLTSQLEQVQDAVSEVAVPEIVGQLQEDISSLASDQAQSKSAVKKLEKELQGLSEVQEQVEEVVSEQEAVSQQLEDISANQEQVIKQQEQLLEAQPGSVLNSLKNLWSGISPARLLGSLNNATQWFKNLFTF